MSQYYYSVAALPALRLEETPVYSSARFAEQCAVDVSPADLALILSARVWPDSTAVSADGPAVLRAWYAHVADLQRYLGAARASKLGWDASELPRAAGIDPSIAESARQLVAEEDPARAEAALLRLLWSLLDTLEVGHYFDVEKLIIYYLRLQLVERRQTLIDVEAGQAEFKRQYNTVAETLVEHAQ